MAPASPLAGGSAGLKVAAAAKNSHRGRVEIETALVEVAPPPIYEQIADKAHKLREFGMSYRAIARALGVDGETAANGWQSWPR